ncbi:hypothetical protein ACFC06_06465 [Nocardia sp. NPDC056064]|uniref:hypothetical protein n=1 Tax=Nocardia sp. NPDC056064 TaxID=3345701 RepID=UPI0035DC8295
MSKLAELLVICGFAAVVLGGIIAARVLTADRNKRGLSAAMLKMYGLLSVGTLGLVLTVLDIDLEAKTPAYTLLGLIAGYLAGVKIEAEPTGNSGTKL